MNRSESMQTSGQYGNAGGERLTGMLEVNVSKAEDLDPALEEAIAVITKTAAQHHIGVMVTRTGSGRYIVRAHPAVP
ncbi:hypothetical protein [Arthrobacter bambusae]|uniref:hypothetical protein n=1 Tax=Arthrobacter bambusae TaxID=1338426 RepID=UPI0027818F27|nr:hypothetical protein [Arthrobacter bambusae]MDQ0239508.1 hypothetical protein [Arthrobacter bambusae]